MSDKIRYVRQLSLESAGEAPGRGRLQGRRILVVGGGQRTFDAVTDPVGNGRAMSLLFAREGAHVAVVDLNRAAPMTPSSALQPREAGRFRSKPTSRAKTTSTG
jgi:NAD(P)-dependent dehydrogenase (short-subunit alcohol dehydrogenase family)